MRTTHIASGTVLSVVGLIFLFWVIPATTSPPSSPLDLAPAFIPMVAVSTFLALSALLALTAIVRGEEERALHEEFGDDATGMGKREFINLGLWTLAAATSWLVMNHVGFEPAMTLFLAATLAFIGLRNYWLLAAIAIGTPIFLSQFVWYMFNTQMPGFWR